MKKKIIIFSMLFILAFSSTAFAKTLNPVGNVAHNKIWTITFNKNIKDADIVVLNSSGHEEVITFDIKNNKAIVTSLRDYIKGIYIIKVKNAIATDGSRLKEPIDMQFTVR